MKALLRPVYGDMDIWIIEYTKNDTLKDIMDREVGDDEYPSWYGYEELQELFENSPKEHSKLFDWFCKHQDYSEWQRV